MCLNEEPFELPFLPGKTTVVHRGMLNSARYVFSKLENEKILDDLFILHPDFNLVITGHSLGAGVASLLAIMLKAKYPNVRCFAFSPPGCVISDNCQEIVQEFVCSVVLGDDLVCRLSRHSMHKLKSQIIEAIENCDKPKYEILLKGCFRLICNTRRSVASQEDEPVENGVLIHNENGDADLEANTTHSEQRQLRQDEPLLTRSRTLSSTGGYQSFSNESTPDNETTPTVALQKGNLHIPGRILHITETGRGSNVYKASWNSHLYFQNVLLSNAMLSDHKPYVVAALLKKVADESAIDV